MRKKKEYWFPGSIEIEEYVDGRYGSPGEKRKKKQEVTPEKIKKINRLNKSKKARRMIKNNFFPGDYYITLTFEKDKRPKNILEAKKIWQDMQRKIRRECKKQGKEFKWIVLIERGAKGAVHGHLIMNKIENGHEFIQKCWNYGKVYFQLLYEEGGYKDLADYITKDVGDEEKSYYSHSRNLPIPKPRIKKIKGKWKEPKAYKGYEIDKNSIIDGINAIGFRYRSYTMVKLDRRI